MFHSLAWPDLVFYHQGAIQTGWDRQVEGWVKKRKCDHRRTQWQVPGLKVFHQVNQNQ